MVVGVAGPKQEKKKLRGGGREIREQPVDYPTDVVVVVVVVEAEGKAQANNCSGEEERMRRRRPKRGKTREPGAGISGGGEGTGGGAAVVAGCCCSLWTVWRVDFPPRCCRKVWRRNLDERKESVWTGME